MSNSTDSVTSINMSRNESLTNILNTLPDAQCELCGKPLRGIEGAPYRASKGENVRCGSCMKGFYPGAFKYWCCIM